MFDIDDFVVDCQAALAETAPTSAVKEVLERAVSAPTEVEAALGPARSGGMRTIHRSADLTVLQLIWPPHVVLFPHDHRMWAAIGIYGGAEDNEFYRRRAGGIERSGGTRLATGDVGLLGEAAIHAVANPGRGHTAAIHVYGGDYFGVERSQWDPTTLVEEPFDVEAVRALLDNTER